MIKGICPYCEKETELNFVETIEEISVRGEIIKIPATYYKCVECEGDFDDPNSDHDPLALAYKEYRRCHGMMQPEEIRELRRRYRMTQKELSNLLGWGEITLSRYENGALQDAAHDNLLKMIGDPHTLRNLIEQRGDFLSDDRKHKLISLLEKEIEETLSFPYIYTELFGRYMPDILSGFQKLNISKFFQAIVFLCKDGVVKTKLNKLLFYLDFKHFKNNGVSITGMRYVHLTYGPVPENYEHYYATLLNDEGAIRIEEEFNDYGYPIEVLYSNKSADLSVFNDSEKETLIEIKDRFKNYNARAIKDFSHNEKGYKETYDRQIISYAYADDLQI